MNPQAKILRIVSSCAFVATMVAGLTARAESPDGQDGMAEIVDLWWPPVAELSMPFLRGDANLSGAAEVGDAVFILQYLFCRGTAPACMAAADVNDNGVVEMADAILLLGHLFLGGKAPAQPYPFCGKDPSSSGLGCARYIACRQLRCPDPAVEAIDMEIVSLTSRFEGQVRITGRMKNLGGPFDSGAGQQSLQLYEQYTGGLVAHVDFEDLDLGETLEVSYVRHWNASSPSEGEFPPKYMVVISYDPDIYMDGNERNDDCNSDNNVLERSGWDINDLFD